MSRILVTGASGFVGRPLITELLRRGDEVHAISTRDAPTSPRPVRWHRLDLADSAAVAGLVREVSPERLIHLAWFVEHGRFWSAPENVVWVEHSLSLLRAFVAAGGRRVLMTGTCAEYDWSSVDGPLLESGSPLRPATMYGIAKDSLRRLAEAYAAASEVELAWARLFFMYGPREQPERLVPAVIRSLLAGTSVETTSGTQLRDFMHVDDVAGALAALQAGSVTGAVNIASGTGVSIREVVIEIAHQLDAPELLRVGALPERPDEPPVLVGAAARLNEEVGFRPEIGLGEGIADTISWWRER